MGRPKGSTNKMKEMAEHAITAAAAVMKEAVKEVPTFVKETKTRKHDDFSNPLCMNCGHKESMHTFGEKRACTHACNCWEYK